MKPYYKLGGVLFFAMAFLTANAEAESPETEAPVSVFQDEATVVDWLLLGTFPNEPLPEDRRTGGIDREGLYHDFLDELGGEAEAILRPETVVRFTDEEGKPAAAETRRVVGRDPSGVDLQAVYREEGSTDNRVAYAFCWIESDSEREVHALFGSDDGAIVWVNGEKVHMFDAYGRGVNPEDDTFPVSLKAGLNRILVKVENGPGGWGFALRLLSQERFAAYWEAREQRALVQRALGAGMRLGGDSDAFLFSMGEFPEPVWMQPALVNDFFGEMDLRVRWFDGNLNEVTRAAHPGRHAVYVEADGGERGAVRRAATVFIAPEEFRPWRYGLRVPLPELPDTGWDRRVWEEQAEDLAAIGGGAYLDMLYTSPAGARMLAALQDRSLELERDPDSHVPAWLGTQVRDQEFHLRLKAHVLGISLPDSAPLPARLEDGSAPVIKEGALADAGFREGLKEAIDAVSREWAEATGIPFTIFVARHGVVAHHDAYGSQGSEPIDTRTPFDIASISKLITGTVLTHFVDRGLIGLDDPIGRYLPDFPVEGDKVITVRQSMMHLAGTEGHGNFGGLANPWFESQVANGLEWLEPGNRYIYNGLSFNLVARCMEMVSGKSFIRILHEHLYDPLGMEDTRSFDTAFGTRTTAHDLARVGQMLLNRGSYGEWEFFSPESAEMMYPVRVGDIYPDNLSSEVVYGLGAAWLREGSRILTHGSATQSVLRVYFDEDMVVTMARPQGGPNYSHYWERIEAAIEEHLR